MNKQALPAPDYYQPYIRQITATDVVAALEQSLNPLEQAGDISLWQQLGDQVYAPGKWTLRDIFQHLADAERIFCYRALCFARNDRSPLPSFDENIYVDEALANNRPLALILEELTGIRRSSLELFRSFSPDMLQRTGLCMGQETAVATLGFVIAGHQAHHLQVIRERYLPLIN